MLQSFDLASDKLPWVVYLRPKGDEAMNIKRGLHVQI